MHIIHQLLNSLIPRFSEIEGNRGYIEVELSDYFTNYK